MESRLHTCSWRYLRVPNRPSRACNDSSSGPAHVISEADFLQSVSVIPNSPQDRIFSLQERGVLLQGVLNFMLGYNVYLGVHGELAQT